MDGPFINQYWKRAAKEINKELFFPQMMVVPQIEEAPSYDLMMCFTKEKLGTREKMSMVEPRYQLHGNISDLVKRSSEDESPKINVGELLYNWQHSSKEEMEITSYKRTWEGKRRGTSFTLKMTDLTKFVTHLDIGEGDLVIDTNKRASLQGIKTIYIINEVVYADTIRAEFKMANVYKYKLNKRIPVAFSFKKTGWV